MNQRSNRAFNRFLTSSMALAMTAGMLPLSSKASGTFSDTENHWAKESIEHWSGYGVVNGYEGLFRPDDSITRGEIAVILNQIMNYQESSSNSFQDLDQNFYTAPLLKLNSAGIMNGYDNNIRPQDAITREEAAVVLANALHIPYVSTSSTGFADNSSISDWAKGAVQALSKIGLVTGREGNNFDPKANITRGEVTTILSQGVDLFVSSSGTYSEPETGTVVVNTPDVTLKDMTIQGDLILAEGIAEGEVYLDNITIEGDVIIKGGGLNSIYMNNVHSKGDIKLAKVGNPVRLVAQGESILPSITVLGDVKIESTQLTGTGSVGNVSIEGGASIALEGIFSVVGSIVADLNINIEGTVGNLELSASATVNGTKLEGDNSYTGTEIPDSSGAVGGDTAGSTDSSNSSSSGGSSSNDDDDDDYYDDNSSDDNSSDDNTSDDNSSDDNTSDDNDTEEEEEEVTEKEKLNAYLEEKSKQTYTLDFGSRALEVGRHILTNIEVSEYELRLVDENGKELELSNFELLDSGTYTFTILLRDFPDGVMVESDVYKFHVVIDTIDNLSDADALKASVKFLENHTSYFFGTNYVYDLYFADVNSNVEHMINALWEFGECEALGIDVSLYYDEECTELIENDTHFKDDINITMKLSKNETSIQRSLGVAAIDTAAELANLQTIKTDFAKLPKAYESPVTTIEVAKEYLDILQDSDYVPYFNWTVSIVQKTADEDERLYWNGKYDDFKLIEPATLEDGTYYVGYFINYLHSFNNFVSEQLKFTVGDVVAEGIQTADELLAALEDSERDYEITLGKDIDVGDHFEFDLLDHVVLDLNGFNIKGNLVSVSDKYEFYLENSASTPNIVDSLTAAAGVKVDQEVHLKSLDFTGSESNSIQVMGQLDSITTGTDLIFSGGGYIDEVNVVTKDSKTLEDSANSNAVTIQLSCDINAIISDTSLVLQRQSGFADVFSVYEVEVAGDLRLDQVKVLALTTTEDCVFTRNVSGFYILSQLNAEKDITIVDDNAISPEDEDYRGTTLTITHLEAMGSVDLVTACVTVGEMQVTAGTEETEELSVFTIDNSIVEQLYVTKPVEILISKLHGLKNLTTYQDVKVSSLDEEALESQISMFTIKSPEETIDLIGNKEQTTPVITLENIFVLHLYTDCSALVKGHGIINELTLDVTGQAAPELQVIFASGFESQYGGLNNANINLMGYEDVKNNEGISVILTADENGELNSDKDTVLNVLPRYNNLEISSVIYRDKDGNEQDIQLAEDTYFGEAGSELTFYFEELPEGASLYYVVSGASAFSLVVVDNGKIQLRESVIENIGDSQIEYTVIELSKDSFEDGITLTDEFAVPLDDNGELTTLTFCIAQAGLTTSQTDLASITPSESSYVSFQLTTDDSEEDEPEADEPTEDDDVTPDEDETLVEDPGVSNSEALVEVEEIQVLANDFEITVAVGHPELTWMNQISGKVNAALTAFEECTNSAKDMTTAELETEIETLYKSLLAIVEEMETAMRNFDGYTEESFAAVTNAINLEEPKTVAEALEFIEVYMEVISDLEVEILEENNENSELEETPELETTEEETTEEETTEEETTEEETTEEETAEVETAEVETTEEETTEEETAEVETTEEEITEVESFEEDDSKVEITEDDSEM